MQKSWFGFDHFYSDVSFPHALEIVFGRYHVRSLYDVGGNTGKWALSCVAHDSEVEVTVLDLPQQIEMMRANVAGKPGAERIKGHAINLLDPNAPFPRTDEGPDAIWMSQFLDCFSIEEIASILSKAKEVMGSKSTLYIMETFWDRQKYEPASLCLTMTSLYFTVMANGNSKMYHSDDFLSVIESVGLKVAAIHDGLGHGHSIMEVTL